MPGAGGYGEPRERDLDELDRDLADGKVTPGAAEQHYGVVVDRNRLEVDRAATQRLRSGRP
jgi:N-methylhydantoinase B